MSYSSVQYPRTSKTQRQRGGAQGGSSYNPRPVNRPQGYQSDAASVHRRGGGPEFNDSSDDEDPRHNGGSGWDGSGGDGVRRRKYGGDHGQDEERTLKSRGTHYVLPPNPSKNAKLRQTAEKEMERWEQHKEEKRERLAQNLSQQRPKAVGGVTYSREELAEKRREQERKQLMDAKYAAIRRKQKSEEYRQESRRREEEEIQRMRQTQREKAKKLDEKKRVQAEVDQDQLRRNRLAYLENKGIT